MAYQLVDEVIRRGPAIRELGLSHRGFVALLVIAEGCHESTHTGRVERARIAGALGTSERSATKAITEVVDADLVHVVQRGHAVMVGSESGGRVQLKRATLFELTLAAVGGTSYGPGDWPKKGTTAPEPRGSRAAPTAQEPRVPERDERSGSFGERSGSFEQELGNPQGVLTSRWGPGSSPGGHARPRDPAPRAPELDHSCPDCGKPRSQACDRLRGHFHPGRTALARASSPTVAAGS